MKKDVAFVLLRGYTLRINQPHYHMTETTFITTKPLSYDFQGKTCWLETGTEVQAGRNFTIALGNGTFLFVPRAFVKAK